MRQIVLDTETTGLSPKQQHKITEIGCVELINRKVTGKVFQTYVNPQREIDAKAAEITGLTLDFLRDYPTFTEVADSFIDFIDGAELIIHNAPFDLGFLDYELANCQHTWGKVSLNCAVIDTLAVSKKLFPGQRNNLDALCKRYQVNNANRTYHGALLDSELLAEVYLRMTAGQINLNLEKTTVITMQSSFSTELMAQLQQLPVVAASDAEQELHFEILRNLSE